MFKQRSFWRFFSLNKLHGNYISKGMLPFGFKHFFRQYYCFFNTDCLMDMRSLKSTNFDPFKHFCPSISRRPSVCLMACNRAFRRFSQPVKIHLAHFYFIYVIHFLHILDFLILCFSFISFWILYRLLL